MADLNHELQMAERRLLKELRGLRRGLRKQSEAEETTKLTFGQQMADGIAAGMGSWPFIIIQSVILFFWIIANVLAWKYKWDPYPFILLNLALSFQAAYAAPITKSRVEAADGGPGGPDWARAGAADATVRTAAPASARERIMETSWGNCSPELTAPNPGGCPVLK